MVIALVSEPLRVRADRAGLDARLNIPYLSPRMTRLLLTLLALLTGLVAQIAPVQARIGGAAGAEVAIQLPSISKRAPVVSRAASRPASGTVWVIGQSQPFAPLRMGPTPTVLSGIDRTRE
jgi:hypothetical protein